MTNQREATAKPLSFSTTMRNPNRIASFLNQVIPFENHILTNEIIDKIVHNVIKNKLYKPVYVNRTPRLNVIFDDVDAELTDYQVAEIIINSPQDHKEYGFDKGWPSRFDTWYKLSKEFGFIFYEMNKPIKISEIGHMLIDALNETPTNEEKIQNVFLNSMMKYQSSNPFRKNSNSNVPLILLLEVIKLLKDDPEENGAGVFRQELSLFICWNDNNAQALYEKIKEIRKSVGFNYSDEYMYDICLEVLGLTTPEEKEEKKRYFKMSKICGEAIDEYIRKMRSTGILSLRGNGRFLDYNSFEQTKIEYVLKNYSSYQTYDDQEEYYRYMGEIDNNILTIAEEEKSTEKESVRIKTLLEFAKNYTKEEILYELSLLSGRRQESRNPVFKLISAPARLEFLTSIALAQQLEGLKVLPNYSVDDEGLPTMTAMGDMADIVCVDEDTDSLIEVTLMCGRTDQVSKEIVPIRRHLLERKKMREETFSVFVAPIIHEDTKEMSLWYKHKDDVDIVPYSIEEFITTLTESNKLIQLLN